MIMVLTKSRLNLNYSKSNGLTMLSSLAGSVLTSSVSQLFSPEPSTRLETTQISMTDTSALPSVPTSADSPPPVTASEHTSPIVDVQKHQTLTTHTSDNLSSEHSDEDAEGEPDEDFDTTMHTQLDDEESDDEEHSLSPRPGKRKKAVEEDDYMMKDPELYGLRRSVRHVLPLLDLLC